jgi:hypothetical protein
VIGALLGSVLLVFCSWCCCLGHPSRKEEEGRRADAPTRRPSGASANYVRRTTMTSRRNS